MKPELKQKIDAYVASGYRAEQQKIHDATQGKMDALPQLGRGNAAYSKYADERFVRLYAERAKTCALAMANIMVDAHEIYGVPLDGAILVAATRVRDETVAGMCGSVVGELQLKAMRTRSNNGEHDKAIAAGFKRQLTLQTHHVVDEISCLIEQRKVAPKYGKRETGVQVFQQGATNPKVVIGIDQSTNNFNNHQVVAHLRDVIKANVPPPDQAALLERLDAVEQAVGEPATFRERWSDLRSAAADYWSFILPAIPAIQDFLHRHGVT